MAFLSKVRLEKHFIGQRYQIQNPKSPEVSDYSDENGNLLFREKGYCDAVFRITKGGYYVTKDNVLFQLPAEAPEHFWQRKEWAPTHLDVTLKTIRNPIPGWLYAGKVITLPRYDIPLGLDLQLLDWVPPYGEGKQTDVILSFHLVGKKSGKKSKVLPSLSLTQVTGYKFVRQVWILLS